MKIFLQRYRVTISFLLAGVLFLLAIPTMTSVLLGLPLIFIGEMIRIWASGSIRKNNALAMTGPYAYTRNPLYLGSFLMGLGFSVMTGRWWVAIAFLSVFYFIYRSTIQMEEKGLSAIFGKSFEQYQSEVPCFFPYRFTVGPTSPEASGFDWSLVKKHREYQTWLGIALGILLMILKMRMGMGMGWG